MPNAKAGALEGLGWPGTLLPHFGTLVLFKLPAGITLFRIRKRVGKCYFGKDSAKGRKSEWWGWAGGALWVGSGGGSPVLSGMEA